MRTGKTSVQFMSKQLTTPATTTKPTPPQQAAALPSSWALRIVRYLYNLSAFLLLLLGGLAFVLNTMQGSLWAGLAYLLMACALSLSLFAIAQGISILLDIHSTLSELMRRLKAR